MRTITITGHRPKRIKGKETLINEWLKQKFNELKPDLVVTGMAQGVDQIAAWICYDEGIPYYCYFPVKKEMHPEVQFLFDNCAGYNFLKEKYEGPADYILRDQKMVEMCDIVLAVWDGQEYGGTWDTMEYAKKLNKQIYVLEI